MLDKIKTRFDVGRDVLHTDGYRPQDAITQRRLINADGKKLCVLFPPWHGGSWAYEALIRRLARRGYAVLAYSFHDQILKPDAQQVVASYQYIQKAISDDLKKLSKTYDSIWLIGLSVGILALTMTSEKFDRFERVSLVIPSVKLSYTLWNAIRTRRIRDGLEAQGYTVESLEELWKPLHTVHRVEALNGKRVDIVVSTADEIILPRYQQDYVSILRRAGVKPQVKTTRVGHYAAIVNFCLRTKI